EPRDDVEPTAVCIGLAESYLDFAEKHDRRWRAVFEYRYLDKAAIPGWYFDQTARLFSHLDRPLPTLFPDLSPGARSKIGRSRFSAVHGIVALGLEEKFGKLTKPELRRQLRLFVKAMAGGLASQTKSGLR